MRGLVIFLSVLAVIGAFVVAANMGDVNKDIQNKEDSQILEFSTFTSAVCENKGDFVNCKDELFVNCNGVVSKVESVAECNGLNLEIPKATGAAVFGRGWKDPRI